MKQRIRVDEVKPGDFLVSRRLTVTRAYPARTVAGKTVIKFKEPDAGIGVLWCDTSMVDVERKA